MMKKLLMIGFLIGAGVIAIRLLPEEIQQGLLERRNRMMEHCQAMVFGIHQDEEQEEQSL